MKSGLIRDFRVALRIVRGTFDFAGRSRRTEAVMYLFVFWAISGVSLIAMSIATSMPGRDGVSEWLLLGRDIFSLVVWIPLFAWAVRRAHDAGGSGLYCLPLFAMLAARWLDLPDLVDSVLRGFIAIQIVILFIASPDAGPNRFGPNPRQDERIAVVP